MDLDLLTDELSEEVGPSNAGATSPTVESALGAPEPIAGALESILESEAAKNTPTMPASIPTEV